MPKIYEIASEVGGRGCYSIFDVKDGYLHVRKEQDCFDYCTFSTSFGRYQYCRKPFRIYSAHGVFQKMNYEMFGDLGASSYFEYLKVYDKDEAEHDKNLIKLLKKAREYNVKFNEKKIQFKSDCVQFMGHIYFAKMNRS